MVEPIGQDDKEIVVEGELAASKIVVVVAVSVFDVDVALLTNTNLLCFRIE